MLLPSSLSGETECSFPSLERSLSPPSYEAHLKNSASHTTSSHQSLDTPYKTATTHQQTAPTNYSLSWPNPRVTLEISSVHPDVRKSVRSPPAYPYSPAQALPPPPPRYTSNPHITLPPHQATEIDECRDYSVGVPSQNAFLPNSFPLLSAAPFENYPDFQDYSRIISISDVPDKPSSISNAIHLLYPDDTHISHKQKRSQDSHDRTFRYSEQKTLYINDSQDSDITLYSGAPGIEDQKEVHSLIKEAKRLWFIPHQEQNRVYIKRKELAKSFLSHPG